VPTLAQLLAIAKQRRKDANDAVTAAYHLAQKPALFNGMIKTYQPRDEDGVQLPSESQKVQQTVPNLYAAVRKAMAALFDVDADIATTNTFAKADVKIGDTVLLTGVYVPHLLFLEKQLTDLHTFVSKVPTLDPSVDWKLNDQTGLWETDKVQTHRTQRVKEYKVVVQATDKFPAQVASDEKDQVVGYWDTTRLSGAVPVTYQRKMLARISELLQAVKAAREEANRQAVASSPTSSILGYVFEFDA